MIKVDRRKSKFTELIKYDHLAKEHDFIEVCEWANGEGFDVTINQRQFHLSWGEFEALTVLVHYKE